MHATFKNWRQKFADFVPEIELTCGIGVVIALSCTLSVLTNFLDISEHFFSLESSAIVKGHGKRFFTNYNVRSQTNTVAYPLTSLCR